MANVSKEQKRITRERIRNHAARLFAEQGFADTTVREIALAADVSESSIFTYFDSKDELLVRVILPEETGETSPIHAPSPLQTIHSITRYFYEPYSSVDKQLLCEYQAAICRVNATPQNLIHRDTLLREQAYANQLQQTLESFDVDEAPIVGEIVVAIGSALFQTYLRRNDVTFGQFLNQTDEQVQFLLGRLYPEAVNPADSARSN